MSGESSDLRFIRLPQPGQGHSIAEDAAALLLESIQDVKVPTKEQVSHAITNELDSNPSLAVVDLEGSVIGTGGLLLIEEGGLVAAAIVNMAVAPNRRGEGLGAEIMSRLAEEAVKHGAQELFGQPHPGSLGFYEKLGCHLAERPYIKGSVLIKPL